MPLRDVLCPQPRLLFVGINPSLRSEELGHHFAGPGNPFWRLLYASSLIPVEIDHRQDRRLAEFGIALTNLCPRATRAAAELTRDEMEAGRTKLLAKIARLRPRVVVLVGVTLYKQILGRTQGPSGPGAKPETLAGAHVFVLPNPSGLNAAYPGFKHKLIWFDRLREFGEGVA